jgi:hypothetical protein
VMPYFILGNTMTCSKADTPVVGRLTTIFMLLSDSALTMTFFTAVSPSKFNMCEFWNTSYVGRFLFYLLCFDHQFLFPTNAHQKLDRQLY